MKVLLVKMGPRLLSAIDTLIASYINFLSKYRSILVVLAVVQLFDSFFASLRDMPTSIAEPLNVDLFVYRQLCMDPAVNPRISEFIAAAGDAATEKLTTDIASMSAKRDRASNGAAKDLKRPKPLHQRLTLKPITTGNSAPELGSPAAQCCTMCVDFALKKRACNHPGLCTRPVSSMNKSKKPKLHAWPTGTTSQQKTDYATLGAAQPGLQ